MEQVDEEDENKTVGALQSHHSRTTENRIYGLSSMALLSGWADDVFLLYLEHSTDWQGVCGVAKGGSLKPYRQSMAKNVVGVVATPQPVATTGLANKLLAALMPALTQAVEAAVSKHLIQHEAGGSIPKKPISSVELVHGPHLTLFHTNA